MKMILKSQLPLPGMEATPAASPTLNTPSVGAPPRPGLTAKKVQVHGQGSPYFSTRWVRTDTPPPHPAHQSLRQLQKNGLNHLKAGKINDFVHHAAYHVQRSFGKIPPKVKVASHLAHHFGKEAVRHAGEVYDKAMDHFERGVDRFGDSLERNSKKLYHKHLIDKGHDPKGASLNAMRVTVHNNTERSYRKMKALGKRKEMALEDLRAKNPEFNRVYMKLESYRKNSKDKQENPDRYKRNLDRLEMLAHKTGKGSLSYSRLLNANEKYQFAKEKFQKRKETSDHFEQKYNDHFDAIEHRHQLEADHAKLMDKWHKGKSQHEKLINSYSQLQDKLAAESPEFKQAMLDIDSLESRKGKMPEDAYNSRYNKLVDRYTNLKLNSKYGDRFKAMDDKNDSLLDGRDALIKQIRETRGQLKTHRGY